MTIDGAAATAPDFGNWSLWGVPDPNPTGASTRWDGGRVRFANLSYLISVGDDQTVLVLNLQSGEQYLAWGPPQMWVDGEHAFDFWGTTTLVLEDGTKLSIVTEPLGDDPLATVSNKVVITNADYGVEVFGLAGPLGFNETLAYGWLLDAVVGDGNTVVENITGQGFVGDADGDGQWLVVDPAYIAATDMAKIDAAAQARGAAWLSMASLVTITMAGMIRTPLAHARAAADEEHARALTESHGERDAERRWLLTWQRGEPPQLRCWQRAGSGAP